MSPKKNRQATRTTPGFTGPFKGSPQQGTLFDKRTIAKSGDEIGPRGYSLNRSRQFNDVIQQRVGFTKQPDQVSFGVKHEDGGPAVDPDQHPFGPSHHGEGFSGLAKSMGRGRSKLIDTLARSTVSPEHLEGLHAIHVVHPKDPDVAGTYSPGENYRNIKLHTTNDSEEYPDRYPEEVKQPQQRGPEDPGSEMTLLHEIGHHVSAAQGTEHSQYRALTDRGREEGFADEYMLTHFRQDKRSAKWKGNIDPREHTYAARGGHSREKWGSCWVAGVPRYTGTEEPAPEDGPGSHAGPQWRS